LPPPAGLDPGVCRTQNTQRSGKAMNEEASDGRRKGIGAQVSHATTTRKLQLHHSSRQHQSTQLQQTAAQEQRHRHTGRKQHPTAASTTACLVCVAAFTAWVTAASHTSTSAWPVRWIAGVQPKTTKVRTDRSQIWHVRADRKEADRQQRIARQAAAFGCAATRKCHACTQLTQRSQTSRKSSQKAIEETHP
jgi:hypothetical protein